MPGETCSNNSMARARPRTVLQGSCDFSNRMDASVRSLSATDVLRTLAAWKVGALQHDAFRIRADGAVQAADHAGKRDGAFRIGDHQV